MNKRNRNYSWVKRFGGVVLVSVALCPLFLVGCVQYTNVSNDVDYYVEQKFALGSGSSYTFNLKEIFADSGLDIDKYEIEGGEGKNYTVKGETITARGTGISSIDVTLYVPSEETRYVCSLGTLYSYYEQDFTSVSTASELQNMTLDGRYILRSDIDLAGMDWEPVGNFPDGNQFVGMLINPYGRRIIRQYSKCLYFRDSA